MTCAGDRYLLTGRIMKLEAQGVAGAWRVIRLTLLVAILLGVLLASAIPWVARKATHSLAATLP